MRIELAKLILAGTSITYQATGDAGYVPVIQQQYLSHKYEYQFSSLLTCPYYIRTPKILHKCINHISMVCSVGFVDFG